VAQETATAPHRDLLSFALAVAGETFVGVLLAFAASLPFVGVRMAGGLMGIQMGFGIVSVMGARGDRSPIVSQLLEILAIVLFLLLSGHHLLLRGLGITLRLAPLGGAELGPGIAGQLLGMAGSIFVVALSIGAPIMAVLFLTDAAMGFVARTVPQMNIFIVGFPIKIGLGILGIALTLPYFFRTIQHLISGLERDLLALLTGM
jgi:flagellar biosynthetic protein FliR